MTIHDQLKQDKLKQDKLANDKQIAENMADTDKVPKEKYGNGVDNADEKNLTHFDSGSQNPDSQNPDSQNSGSQNLRQKAEDLVNKSSDALNVNHLTIDAINQLLHELQVHQIELEMQNEELQGANIALDILRSRYFDLYDLAPVGYLTLNAQGLIQKANLTVASLLGMTRNKLIKQPISNLIFKEDEDIYYLHHKKLLACTEPQSFDLRIIKFDNTIFWANVVITFGNDNESSDTYSNNDAADELRVVISDISARKQAELAMIVAKKVAEEANLAKSTFLSSMSHELRTPLNAILGFAQLLEVSQPPISENQKRNTEQIVKAGWYLLTLINEILDLAVIESGKTLLDMQSISLNEVLIDSCTMLENQAEKCGIKIDYVPEHFLYTVQADYVRLKQVFVNLISNGVKYNKLNGSVTITCWKLDNDRIRIAIADTGEGISAINMSQLFQPFNRLGKQTSKIEGTGIGLVVCKRIIEAMNGAIGVESVLDRGSTFWVELDLLKPV